jgi:DNA-binding transcriptional ArsR family regulator
MTMKTLETGMALMALAALAQESRLAVFRLLIEHSPDGLVAGAVAEKLSLAPATLSFHLKELARAGLISSSQVGRFIWYRADIVAMNRLIAYLTKNCCSGSAVCDPACAPTAATSQPVRVKLPAIAVKRAPRRRDRA